MLGSVTVLVDDDREDPSAADEVAALEPGRAARTVRAVVLRLLAAGLRAPTDPPRASRAGGAGPAGTS